MVPGDRQNLCAITVAVVLIGVINARSRVTAGQDVLHLVMVQIVVDSQDEDGRRSASLCRTRIQYSARGQGILQMIVIVGLCLSSNFRTDGGKQDLLINLKVGAVALFAKMLHLVSYDNGFLFHKTGQSLEDVGIDHRICARHHKLLIDKLLFGKLGSPFALAKFLDGNGRGNCHNSSTILGHLVILHQEGNLDDVILIATFPGTFNHLEGDLLLVLVRDTIGLITIIAAAHDIQGVDNLNAQILRVAVGVGGAISQAAFITVDRHALQDMTSIRGEGNGLFLGRVVVIRSNRSRRRTGAVYNLDGDDDLNLTTVGVMVSYVVTDRRSFLGRVLRVPSTGVASVTNSRLHASGDSVAQGHIGHIRPHTSGGIIVLEGKDCIDRVSLTIAPCTVFNGVSDQRLILIRDTVAAGRSILFIVVVVLAVDHFDMVIFIDVSKRVSRIRQNDEFSVTVFRFHRYIVQCITSIGLEGERNTLAFFNGNITRSRKGIIACAVLTSTVDHSVGNDVLVHLVEDVGINCIAGHMGIPSNRNIPMALTLVVSFIRYCLGEFTQHRINSIPVTVSILRLQGVDALRLSTGAAGSPSAVDHIEGDQRLILIGDVVAASLAVVFGIVGIVLELVGSVVHVDDILRRISADGQREILHHIQRITRLFLVIVGTYYAHELSGTRYCGLHVLYLIVEVADGVLHVSLLVV